MPNCKTLVGFVHNLDNATIQKAFQPGLIEAAKALKYSWLVLWESLCGTLFALVVRSADDYDADLTVYCSNKRSNLCII